MYATIPSPNEGVVENDFEDEQVDYKNERKLIDVQLSFIVCLILQSLIF